MDEPGVIKETLFEKARDDLEEIEEEKEGENKLYLETHVDTNEMVDEIIEESSPIQESNATVEIEIEPDNENEEFLKLSEADYEEVKGDIQKSDNSLSRKVVEDLIEVNRKKEEDEKRLAQVFVEMDEKKDIIPEVAGLVDSELKKLEYELSMTTKYALCWGTLAFYTMFSPITSVHLCFFICCSLSSIWAFILGLLMLTGTDSFHRDNSDRCYIMEISYLLVAGGVTGLSITICSIFGVLSQIWMHTRDSVHNRPNPEDHLNLQKSIKKDFCWFSSKSFQIILLSIECLIMIPGICIFIVTNVFMFFKDCVEADLSSNFLSWQVASFVFIVMSGWVPILTNCSRLFCRSDR